MIHFSSSLVRLVLWLFRKQHPLLGNSIEGEQIELTFMENFDSFTGTKVEGGKCKNASTQHGSFFQYIPSHPSPIVFPSTKPLGFQHKVFPFSWPPIMATKIFSRIRPLEYETIFEFIHQVSKHYFFFFHTTYFKQLVLNALTCGFFCVSESKWHGSTCLC